MINAWLIPLAPWLPPITRRVGIPGRSPSFSRAVRAIDQLQRGANRRAGEFRAGLREKCGAFLKAEENSADKTRGVTVRFSGKRVRLMDKGRDPAQPPREDRRGRSEAAHAEDDLRIEFSEDAAAERQTVVKSPNECQNRRRKRRRQSDGGQFFEAKLRPPLEREGVDLLFRNEEEHLVPASPQRLRHGEPRKEMSARSSTCNDGVHLDSSGRDPHPHRHFLARRRLEHALPIDV